MLIKKSANRCEDAFTLMEVSICMILAGIICIISIGWFKTIERGNMALGRKAGEQMRAVYAKQRMELVEEALFAATPTNPINWTWSTLFSASDISNRFPNINTTAVNVSVIPPVSTLDGTVGDSAKTSASNGDGINDIGREH